MSAASVPARSPPTLRGDLLFAPHCRGGKRWWVVYDPLRGAYHRLTDPDFRSLQRGDANATLYQEAAAAGLLIQGSLSLGPASSGTPAQGVGRRWNFMAFRWRGVPMDRGARWLAERSDWLMGHRAIWFWGCVMVLAWGAVLTGWSRLVVQLPAFRAFLSTGNVVMLLGVTTLTKIAHELGHAVACRRLGARVGDIGIMFLCGTPCMYCDVTAAWGLSRRRDRAAVMAAGMYVEWVIAAIAALVWSWGPSQPVQWICIDLLFVCGVSTLVFNGNPLMRYDGYYILSDLLDTPNLTAAAADSWQAFFRSMFTWQGVARRDIPLACYHLVSSVYRSIVSVLVGCWAGRMLMSLHLVPLAVVVVFAASLNGLAPWYRGAREWIRGNGRWRGVPGTQRTLWMAILLVALIAVACYPSTVRVPATGTIQSRDAAIIFVPQGGGRVREVLVTVGQSVVSGQTLAILDHPALEYQRLESLERCEIWRARLAGLDRRAPAEPELLSGRDSITAALMAAEEQLRLIEQQLAAMVIRSPCDGVVLPPSDGAEEGEAHLPSKKQEGSLLPEGRTWCRIAPENRNEVELSIDRDQRRYIGVDSMARVALASRPHCPVESRVLAVLDDDAGNVERLKTSGPETMVRQVRVRCSLPEDAACISGVQARGWIEGPREATAMRVARGLYQLWMR